MTNRPRPISSVGILTINKQQYQGNTGYVACMMVRGFAGNK